MANTAKTKRPAKPDAVTSAEVRAWATPRAEKEGRKVAKTGRVPEIWVEAWNRTHPKRQFNPESTPKATAAA